jgi:hypothetical protein
MFVYEAPRAPPKETLAAKFCTNFFSVFPSPAIPYPPLPLPSTLFRIAKTATQYPAVLEQIDIPVLNNCKDDTGMISLLGIKHVHYTGPFYYFTACFIPEL